MTKEEAVEQYEHTFAGMVLDAWNTPRTGVQLVDFVRKIAPSTRQMLSSLFDDAMRIAATDQAKFAPDSSKRDLSELFGAEKKKGKVKHDDNE